MKNRLQFNRFHQVFGSREEAKNALIAKLESPEFKPLIGEPIVLRYRDAKENKQVILAVGKATGETGVEYHIIDTADIYEKIDFVSGQTDFLSAGTIQLSADTEAAISGLDERLDDLERKELLGDDAIAVAKEGQDITHVSLNVNENDKILSQDNNGLLTTLSLSYDSTSKLIYLKGLGNQTISQIDATDFIKDGMLDNAYVWLADHTDSDHIPPRYISGNTYIVMIFNGAAGKDTLYVPANSLIDIYTVSANSTTYLEINGYEIGVKVDVADGLAGYNRLEGLSASTIAGIEALSGNVIAYVDALSSNTYNTINELSGLTVWVPGEGTNSAKLYKANNLASGFLSVVEGECSSGCGHTSHAEGDYTLASGYSSHAEGRYTKAVGNNGSHAEGNRTVAEGESSHAEGDHTITSNRAEHAEGEGNVSHSGSTAAEKTRHSIGVGNENNRKNAFEIMQNGDAYLIGVGNYEGDDIQAAKPLQEVISGLSVEISESLASAVSYTTNEIEGVYTSISAFSGCVITYADGQINDVNSNIAELVDSAETLDERISDVESTVGTLSESAETLDGRIDNLAESAETLYDELLKDEFVTSAALNDLNNRVKDIEGDYVTQEGLSAAIEPINTAITSINEKIPEDASAENQLADKAWVKAVNDLANYYNTGSTYTKDEVNSLIGTIGNFHYVIVSELPERGEGNILYLVGPKSGTTGDRYEEYVYANEWVMIGDTSIDLSNYTTKTYVDTELAKKQDALVSGENIKTVNGQPILGGGNIDVKDVFVAEYGVTPYLDVESAYNNGKLIFCYDDARVALFICHGNAAGVFDFTSVDSNYVFITALRKTNSEGTQYTWDNIVDKLWQEKLESGTNIKTINNQSLLGRGNITISADTSGLMPISGGTFTGEVSFTSGFETTSANISEIFSSPHISDREDEEAVVVGGNLFVDGGNISLDDANITGVAYPINDSDAANKSYVDSSVPKLQETTTIVIDALTNLNGRVLTNYGAAASSVTIGDNTYKVIIITYSGEILTRERAENYMEYMTGSRFLPEYDYEKPKNSIIAFADGTLWKPQYSEIETGGAYDGLYLFKLPVEIVWERGAGTNSIQQKGTNASATQNCSVAEGSGSTAGGSYSHAEGYNSRTWGSSSHAEGDSTRCAGDAAHTEGKSTYAVSSAAYAHAEGEKTYVFGTGAHSEGISKQSYIGDFIKGNVSDTKDVVFGKYSVSPQTKFNLAFSGASHSEGRDTLALGDAAHSEGYQSVAYGDASHAEGAGSSFICTITAKTSDTVFDVDSDKLNVGDLLIYHISADTFTTYYSRVLQVTDNQIVTAGFDVTLNEGDEISVVRGVAFAKNSHVEGENSLAYGDSSHAEGRATIASGECSHAEGVVTNAIGDFSHAEGKDTRAKGSYSHSEGYITEAVAYCSHSEGDGTQAIGRCSHAEGLGTQAKNQGEHSSGVYNFSHSETGTTFGYSGNTIFSVGIGEELDRGNALEIMQNGDIYVNGVGGYTGTTIGGDVKTLQSTINSKPTISGATNIVVLTQSEYDSLVTKDNNTLYFIK